MGVVGASVRTLYQTRSSLSTGRYYPSSRLRKIASANDGSVGTKSKSEAIIARPIFGIVAALTSDGVIGINGRLPWNDVPIPRDRDHFVNLTRNKILIVGRKTFAEEDPTGAHIDHVRLCIVVSKTMDASDLVGRNDCGSADEGDNASVPEVKFARSFEEALELASLESLEINGRKVDDDEPLDKNGTINCWVAGGERIYREALQHGNVSEVHLTRVDMTVDLTTRKTNTVAFFPVEYLDRYGFEEVSMVNSGICSFSVYKQRPT